MHVHVCLNDYSCMCDKQHEMAQILIVGYSLTYNVDNIDLDNLATKIVQLCINIPTGRNHPWPKRPTKIGQIHSPQNWAETTRGRNNPDSSVWLHLGSFSLFTLALGPRIQGLVTDIQVNVNIGNTLSMLSFQN